MQLEVGLAGPDALTFRARVLSVPCPPTSPVQVGIVRVDVAVRKVVEGGV
jgi:hypothetical protein